jgi:hypothetical protein
MAHTPNLLAASDTMRSLSSHSRFASAGLTPREFMRVAAASMKNMAALVCYLQCRRDCMRAMLTALVMMRVDEAMNGGGRALRYAFVEACAQLRTKNELK